MSAMEWSQDLSVGFAEIDDDHKKLVDLLNRFNETVSSGGDRAAIAAELDELVSYTSWHFRHEERLMQTHGDPAFFAHQQEHHDLIAQVEALKQRFDDGDEGVIAEMVPFLMEWLVNHILDTDRKTGQFLAANAS